MPGIKIAVQTRVFRQSLKKALHTAQQCGCQGVQIDARHQLRPIDLTDTAARQLRKLLNDLNLRASSVQFPNRRGLAEPTDLERRVDAVSAAIQMASRLSARVLVCSLGRVPAEDDPQRTGLEEVLRLLTARGEQCGVRIALEASDVEPQSLAHLLKGLSPGGIGIDFSPADLVLRQRGAGEWLEALGDRLVHVRANDAVRALGATGGTCVELGRGSADFPELIGRLEQYNYRDWVTIEPRDAADPVTAVENAVAYLQTL